MPALKADLVFDKTEGRDQVTMSRQRWIFVCRLLEAQAELIQLLKQAA